MMLIDRLRAAYAAFSKGDFGLAKTQGEAALRQDPRHPAALQLLGILACQAGDLPRGAEYLRKAIDNGGDNPDNRFNLAKALLDMGRFDEALSLCDGPEASASPILQRIRAEILKAQGLTGEAVWAYEDFVNANPDDFDGWNNLGNARHARGDLEGALTALQEAQRLNPNSSLVHTNIGRVLISLDRHQEACMMLEKAALLAPKDPAPLVELARSLINIDHADAGLRALGAAAQLDPRDPKIFVAMGLAFNDLSNLPQAEKAYRIAVQVGPSHAPGYLDLGILLEKANRLDELYALIGQAVAAGVAGPEIDYLNALALSRKGETGAALEKVQDIQSKAIHPAMIAQFIGQLADRLGETEKAFYAYEDMNRAMAQSPLGVSMDREAYQRDIDGLTARTTASWYASWQKVTQPSAPASPVFLVGFPRSGTTLLDTVLMGHSATHVLEEIPIIEGLSKEIGDMDRIAELGQRDVEALRERYFAELAKVSPPPAGAMVIDKNPLSMIRMPLIHRLFPDAKIILALRHPADVVLSCYMQNFKPTEAMSSFLDLTNASRTYDRIFRYWEQCASVLPLDTHVLRYEAMVEDMESAVRPLFDFLGLPWESQVLDHQKTAVERGYIRTPSYAQVTERVYSSASGRWQRYREYMKEVLPILEPWATRFNYSLD